MPNPRRFSAADFLLLALVLATAGAARAWYLSACCAQGTSDGPFRVQDDWYAERDQLVANLKERGEFMARAPLAAADEKTAHTSFVYPWLLAALARPAGDLSATYQRVRWGQAALGALAAALYFLFARRAFRNRVAALLAGLFCALHPYWVVNVADISDGVLASFLLALCLFFGVRGGQRGGALTSLTYGLGLAALASVRPALLPFAFVAALWFLWRCQRLPTGWMYAVLGFLGFVLGLVPWVTRNFETFRDVTPIVDSAFLHLWAGNNPRATGGPQTEDDMRRALDDANPGRADELKRMSQPERYRALAREAWDEVRRFPGTTARRRLRAAVAFFVGDQWLTDGRLVAEYPPALSGSPEWVERAAPALFAGSLLFMLVLGTIGWRWSYAWRTEAMPSSLAPFWVLLPYLLAHAEALHGPRLPLDGLLLSYAALSLVALVGPAARLGAWREETERKIYV